MKIYLLLYNSETKRQFFKYFNNRNDKDTFKRKLKYSKRIHVIEDSDDIYFND